MDDRKATSPAFMRMPWTLQRYIFREMGKTFALTAVALTGILGLGGGVLNILELGDATPGQVLRLVFLVVPVAGALTLPIAALFSAAATYGRLSADNEFVACRASGINLHVLLLPTVVLSLVSAIITFMLSNYLIPGMVGNLNQFLKADIGAIIQQRLNRPRGITLGDRFRIYADEGLIDPGDANQFVLRKIAYIEVDAGQWVRFGTAGEVRLTFDRDGDTLSVSGVMSDLSYYDRKSSQFFSAARQRIGANEIPSLVPAKIKFLNLNELFYYLSKPGQWTDVVDELTSLRVALARSMLYDTLAEDWKDGQRIQLRDDEMAIDILAKTCARLPRDGGLELSEVSMEERRGDRVTLITAKRAIIEVTHGGNVNELGVQVEIFDARRGEGGTFVDRSREMRGPVALPHEIIEAVTTLDHTGLFERTGDRTEGPVAQKRAAALDAWGETIRRIRATINERVAFSISVLFLVVIAAVLGIVFRGAHVLTAFGISFVPSLLVLITIVMGKQLAQNAGTDRIGLALMWSGITCVAGLNYWMLMKVLRR